LYIWQTSGKRRCLWLAYYRWTRDISDAAICYKSTITTTTTTAATTTTTTTTCKLLLTVYFILCAMLYVIVY